MHEKKSELLNLIASYRNDMCLCQKELTKRIAISPSSGGKGEWEKATYIIEFLKSIGFDSITECNAPDERVEEGSRPNFYVTFPGKQNEKTCWIMCHLDVVPAGDLTKWESDPFEVIEKDGKLIGRGVEDNQQGIVSTLFTFKAMKELNIVPEYTVSLLFVSDEETGNEYGIRYVLSQQDLFKKDDLIIVPDAGSPDGTMIEVAEKSILWIEFKVTGKQIHASIPERGINAHRAGAYLITQLDGLYKKYSISDSVFDPPISTFEPTKKLANVPNINTVPGEDVFYFDCRILPNYAIGEIIEEVTRIKTDIEKEFKVSVELAFPQQVEAARGTPTDAPVVKKLTQSIKEVLGVDAKPMGIGGSTVATHIRKHGFHVAVAATIADVAHEANEYCIIDNMVADAQIYAHLLTSS